MPSYKFACDCEICPNDNIVEIEMKMSEYTDKHYCPVCGGKLNRTADSLVCGYIGDKDFYGKVSK